MGTKEEQWAFVETSFVGRTTCLNMLESAWDKHKIFGVYGLRAVGKSRTVREFFMRKFQLAADANGAENEFANLRDIIVDMRHMKDPYSLHANLCAILEIEPVDNIDDPQYKHKWKQQITETLSNRQDLMHLILFDNAEDIMEGHLKDDFLELVFSYLVTLKNVKQFLTSTTRIQGTYFTHELGPMPEHEASELLDMVAQGVAFGGYKDAIVRLSEGLPLVILMVGSELTAEEGEIEAKDMVDFLTDCRLHALSRENYPEEDRVGDVYKKFIERLTETFRQRLAILGYIPGSFTAEEARSMIIGHPTDAAKVESLMYYRTRSMITYDVSTRRFNIQGILRECLDGTVQPRTA